MPTLELEPISIPVPLWEEPPGVIRVGESRVLLELVLRAFQRGETPESIIRSFRSLRLLEVYAVITAYLADPTFFDAYLRRCDEEAQAIRAKIEKSQPAGVSKVELEARARARSIIP